MNMQRKVFSRDARLSMVAERDAANGVQPEMEFQRPVQQETAIERWRGEASADPTPSSARIENAPAEGRDPSQAKASPAANRARKRIDGRTRALLVGGLVLALGTAGWFGNYYWTV